MAFDDGSQPYPGSIQGFSWAGAPPSAMNPFAVAGTSMIQDYAYMRQQGQIAQYQQFNTPTPQTSMWNQSAVAYAPQYQYGVIGGQYDTYNNINRQAGITGTAFAVSAGAMAASWPLFMGGDAIGGAMANAALRSAGLATSGMLGIGSRFVLGGAVGMAVTAPFQMIADRGIDRARFAADIEGDVEAYSGRWTGGAGFGRPNTKMLGRSMMEDMYEPGQFFRAGDQMKINKMGLASGMLKGRDISEYKKNFDDLKTNVKDVMELLNTTLEGGLSVMKEMQGLGFKDGATIRSQIVQAKAWGASSGIGTQNMLQIGAAGAQASMGTGWSPSVGASMYQGGAVLAANMANTSYNSAEAVRGLGGIANAGGALGGAYMNILRSGMGIQSMAYVMDPNTKEINTGRLQKLLSGKASAMDITSGAANYGITGPNGGAAGRVTFERDMMRLIQKGDFATLGGMAAGQYVAWANDMGRGGVSDASAFGYARMFTKTYQEADLLKTSLLNPRMFSDAMLSQRAGEMMQRTANLDYRSPFMVGVGNFSKTSGELFNMMGDATYDLGHAVTVGSARAIGGVVGKIARGLGADVFTGLGLSTAPPSQEWSMLAAGAGRASYKDIQSYRRSGKQGGDYTFTSQYLSRERMATPESLLYSLGSDKYSDALASLQGDLLAGQVSSATRNMLGMSGEAVKQFGSGANLQRLYETFKSYASVQNNAFDRDAKNLAEFRIDPTSHPESARLIADSIAEVNRLTHMGSKSLSDAAALNQVVGGAGSIVKSAFGYGKITIGSTFKSYANTEGDRAYNLRAGGLIAKHLLGSKVSKMHISEEQLMTLTGAVTSAHSAKRNVMDAASAWANSQENAVEMRNLVSTGNIDVLAAGITSNQHGGSLRGENRSLAEFYNMWQAADKVGSYNRVVSARAGLYSAMPFLNTNAKLSGALDDVLTNPEGSAKVAAGIRTLMDSSDPAANDFMTNAFQRDWKTNKSLTDSKVFVSKLLNSGQSLDSSNALREQLISGRSNIDKMASFIRNMDSGKQNDPKLIEGIKDADGKVIDAKNVRAAQDRLIQQNASIKSILDEGAATGNAVAQNTPPNILNYWNNRWMI